MRASRYEIANRMNGLITANPALTRYIDTEKLKRDLDPGAEIHRLARKYGLPDEKLQALPTSQGGE